MSLIMGLEGPRIYDEGPRYYPDQAVVGGFDPRFAWRSGVRPRSTAFNKGQPLDGVVEIVSSSKLVVFLGLALGFWLAGSSSGQSIVRKYIKR